MRRNDGPFDCGGINVFIVIVKDVARGGSAASKRVSMSLTKVIGRIVAGRNVALRKGARRLTVVTGQVLRVFALKLNGSAESGIRVRDRTTILARFISSGLKALLEKLEHLVVIDKADDWRLGQDKETDWEDLRGKRETEQPKNFTRG